MPCHKHAERVVRRRDRVRGVTNLITVRPRVKPSPADLKRKIEAALVWNAELDAERITLDLQGNKVIPKRERALTAGEARGTAGSLVGAGVTSFDPRHPLP